MNRRQTVENKKLIEKLGKEHSLSEKEWVQLFETYTDEDRDYAANIAREITVRRFGRRIYFRGIVEFTNICKNDCLYCGIRCSNRNAARKGMKMVFEPLSFRGAKTRGLLMSVCALSCHKYIRLIRTAQ